MPTYEYQCKTCGHQFEQFQRYTDPALTECPRCSGAIRRVIFPAGVIFKGSGWYITDSRKAEPAAAGTGDVKATSVEAGASDKAAGDSVTPDKTPAADKASSSEKATSTATATKTVSAAAT